MNHSLYMKRCIELARRSQGYNQPNPQVGALLVHQDEIIGEGWHQQYGQPHAEVNAIASVRSEHLHKIKQSTIYVTLEPCFHYGKTPPCVDLILKHKIPRVVIGHQDPFEKVAGQSVEKLRAAGVEVITDVLEDEIEWLNRRFFMNCRQKRAYVVLKYAQSKDGYLGYVNETTPITDEAARRVVHKWRSQEAAILVGTQTARVDNPRLNNRYWGERQPVRVVIDKNLGLPMSLNLFDESQKTIVFTTAHKKAISNHIIYEQIDFSTNVPQQITTILYEKHKIASVLVEGGAFTLQSFIDEGLWDEAKILTANKTLGYGIAAPQLKDARMIEEKELGVQQICIFAHSKK